MHGDCRSASARRGTVHYLLGDEEIDGRRSVTEGAARAHFRLLSDHLGTVCGRKRRPNAQTVGLTASRFQDGLSEVSEWELWVGRKHGSRLSPGLRWQAMGALAYRAPHQPGGVRCHWRRSTSNYRGGTGSNRTFKTFAAVARGMSSGCPTTCLPPTRREWFGKTGALRDRGMAAQRQIHH